MAEAHNVFALLENEASRAGLLDSQPNKRPFVLTRAGFAGIQRSAAVWTGDATSDFPALSDTLPMLLGLGLSGVPLVGSDVGGWQGGGSPELFARWIALGSVSPFVRAHVQSAAPAQEPWSFGEEVEDISRIHLSERYRLLPTFYSLMWEATQTGAPLLRPLLWHFQQDVESVSVDDQAMLGPWILVAPILEEGALTQSTFLPPGLWMEYHSGALYEGPATVETGATWQALPMFLRQGAIVPKAQLMQYSDEEPIDPLTLDLFPGPEATSFTLYEDDGQSMAYTTGAYAALTYTLQGTATGATLVAGPREGTFEPPGRRLVVRVRRVDQTPTGVTLDGVALPMLASVAALHAGGEGWVHDTADLALLVAFTDQDDITLSMAYDPTIADLAPPVPVQVQVHLPPGTPTDTPIHISTDANGWSQQALDWGPGPDMASGTVMVPRGDWWFYKYTRGNWSSVEKWPDCLEADNRYHFGKAWPVKEDTVSLWADLCL
jgi:alpha-glucosidase